MKQPTRRKTYWFLFIPLWTISETVDEDAIYDRLKDRFSLEMDKALEKELGENR